MRMLDLFSGIGGFSLAASWAGIKTVGFCEIDKFCQQVLKKHWPHAPIHDDIRTLKNNGQYGAVDIVCGGYPCQPFSTAGKMLGRKDSRYLWPEMRRVIQELRPRWVIAENVRGHVRLGFDTVASQLEDDGFTVWPFIIPACAVGAPHKRERVWIVAYAQGNVGSKSEARHRRQVLAGGSEEVAYANGAGFKELRQSIAASQAHDSIKCSGSGICNATGERLPNWAGGQMEQPTTITELEQSSGQEIERNFRGMAYGVSRRVDRIKGLGNAIVPQVAYQIFKAIMILENNRGCDE